MSGEGSASRVRWRGSDLGGLCLRADDFVLTAMKARLVVPDPAFPDTGVLTLHKPAPVAVALNASAAGGRVITQLLLFGDRFNPPNGTWLSAPTAALHGTLEVSSQRNLNSTCDTNSFS